LANESLALLNQEQRQVIYMVFFEGLSLKDVADQTGMTFVNVRHYYYRGLKRLRECLSARPSGGKNKEIATLGNFDPANV